MTLKESEKHLQHELERIKELLKIEQQNHRETLAKVFWIMTRLDCFSRNQNRRNQHDQSKEGKHCNEPMRSRVMQTSWSAGNASEILLVIVWHGSGSFLKQSQKADKKKDHNQWITCDAQRSCPIKGFRWLCVQFTLVLLKCFRGVNQFRCIDFD